jgi:DNA-binding NtrC family response regulator
MGKPLHVLMVEDSADDAELIIEELQRGGYDVSTERVQTASGMREALGRARWDMVVSDYDMPTFSGPEALEVLKTTGQDLPFIIVSGTIGEETAVAALKAGAHDFLGKTHLARLLPAVERELRDVWARRERTLAHDFNNLLTAILGYSELLTDQIGPEEQVGRDLREIMKAAQRAAGLTKQLLAFSRRQVVALAP